MRPLRAVRRVFPLLLGPLLFGGCDILSSEDERSHFTVIGQSTDGVLNDRDQVAFTERDTDGTPRPVLYDDGSVTPLPLQGESGSVVDLNDRGDVLGYDPRPVAWRTDGSVVEFALEGFEVAVYQLNEGGAVIGGRRLPEDCCGWAPVLWPSVGRSRVLDLPEEEAAMNDREDAVAGNVVLLADGTRLVLGELGVGILFAITNARQIFARYSEGYVERYDLETRTGTGTFSHPRGFSFNELGDVAYTRETCQPISHECTRSHHFVRHRVDGGVQHFVLDTFPGFGSRIQDLRIADLNDRGVLLLEGWRTSPNAAPNLALYRHPALLR